MKRTMIQGLAATAAAALILSGWGGGRTAANEPVDPGAR